MTYAAPTIFRLVKRGGAGLCCDEEGVALGPLALATRSANHARSQYRPGSVGDIADALYRAYGVIDERTLEFQITGIARVAAALSSGDHVRARIAAVQLRFPEIAPERMAKLAQVTSLRKYNRDQPRAPAGNSDGGQWTSGEDNGGGSSAKDAVPASNNNSEPSTPPQVAQNDTGVMSDASNALTSQADKDRYVTLNDGTVPKDHLGNPLKKPPGVSLENNARLGQSLSRLDEIPGMGMHGELVKAAAMMALFSRKTGSMDYQWVYRTNDKDNPDYIDFGNYNYGVVAAAAGYSWNDTMIAAGLANSTGSGDKSGPWWNSSRNLPLIRQGYEDYEAGKIIPLDKAPSSERLTSHVFVTFNLARQ